MLTQIKTVYGDRLWIDQYELQRAQSKGRKLIKIYRKDGRELQHKNRRRGTQLLHIDNIQKRFTIQEEKP